MKSGLTLDWNCVNQLADEIKQDKKLIKQLQKENDNLMVRNVNIKEHTRKVTSKEIFEEIEKEHDNECKRIGVGSGTNAKWYIKVKQKWCKDK